MVPEISYPPWRVLFGRASRNDSREYTLSGNGGTGPEFSASGKRDCTEGRDDGLSASVEGSTVFLGGRSAGGGALRRFRPAAAGAAETMPGITTLNVTPHLRQRTLAPLTPLITESFIQ